MGPLGSSAYEGAVALAALAWGAVGGPAAGVTIANGAVNPFMGAFTRELTTVAGKFTIL